MAKYMWLLLIVFASSKLAYANETLSIATGDYPPGYSEYAPHYGYTLHVVEEAFAQVGIEVKYHFLPWKRAFEDTRLGESYDATCCWFLSEDRETFFYVSDPVIETEGFYFFHLKEKAFDWHQLSDLQPLRIGATRGYTLGDEFYAAEAAGELEVMWVNQDIQALRMLRLGRVDIVPLDTMAGYELIRKNFTPEEQALFTHHAFPLLQSPTHLLFPKAREEESLRLRQQFNEGLQRLKASSAFDAIMDDAMSGYYQIGDRVWQEAE